MRPGSFKKTCLPRQPARKKGDRRSGSNLVFWTKVVPASVHSESNGRARQPNSPCFMLNHLHWFFYPTALCQKRQKEKYMRTYGLRPEDLSSVSEMCYMLIVVWLCARNVLQNWLSLRPDASPWSRSWKALRPMIADFYPGQDPLAGLRFGSQLPSYPGELPY